MVNKGRQLETRYYNQETFEDGTQTRKPEHVGVTDSQNKEIIYVANKWFMS